MGRVNRNFFVFVCVWGGGGVTIHRNSRMLVSKKRKVFRLRAISIIFFFFFFYEKKKKKQYGQEEYYVRSLQFHVSILSNTYVTLLFFLSYISFFM